MNQYPLFFMGMAFLVMAPGPDFMNESVARLNFVRAVFQVCGRFPN
jgi:hypothetical protein